MFTSPHTCLHADDYIFICRLSACIITALSSKMGLMRFSRSGLHEMCYCRVIPRSPPTLSRIIYNDSQAALVVILQGYQQLGRFPRSLVIRSESGTEVNEDAEQLVELWPEKTLPLTGTLKKRRSCFRKH